MHYRRQRQFDERCQTRWLSAALADWSQEKGSATVGPSLAARDSQLHVGSGPECIQVPREHEFVLRGKEQVFHGLVGRVQLALGALAPVTAPAVAVLFWTSARTRVIRWRHIEYEVLGPEQVRVLRRHTPGAAA